MSFLQPLLLIALPLIALPIIIHLIHQRRFQTVQWAAMAFLLAATKMSKGYAKLRQWLILAARTLAIAGLIFAVSRPLSSGWLGMAASGRIDTTIILLDRSASMSQIGAGGRSKLESGVRRLQKNLRKLESDHYVLIDSSAMVAQELDSLSQLSDSSLYGGTSSTASIPEMLEIAAQFLREQQPGRTEVWICSDHRVSDWDTRNGRWKTLRDSLRAGPQTIQFHSLAFDEPYDSNYSLRGEKVRRVDREGKSEVLVSFQIERQNANESAVDVPLQLELNGVVTEIDLQLTNAFLEISDYAIEVDPSSDSGWGRLSLPEDENDQDNHFYFTYQREPVRQTLIVSEDPSKVPPLQFATSVTSDPTLKASSSVCSPSDVLALDHRDYCLVLWQAPIPMDEEPVGRWLKDYRRRGGVSIFFPPEQPSDERFASMGWQQWSQQSANVTSWEADRDLLGRTLGGDALPVGEVRVGRVCSIQGEYSTLATLSQGSPWLVKSIDDGGSVYFCGTTVDPLDSNLASSGVILFAMIQRAMEMGVRTQGIARFANASSTPLSTQWPRSVSGSQEMQSSSPAWVRLAGAAEVRSTEYSSHAGVYQSADRLLAVNRSEAEDDTKLVSDDQLKQLFSGLSFRTVRDEVGTERSLIQEVWRLFLILMLLMLLSESALSLPRTIRSRSQILHARAEG